MKRLITFVLLTVVVSAEAGDWIVSRSQAQNPSRIRAVAAREEAEKQARLFWLGKLTVCGQDYFTKIGDTIYQFSNIEIQVISLDVSGADRLNGTQWRGRTTLSAAQSRVYSAKRTLHYDVGWSKWTQGLPGAMSAVGLSAEVRKENGRWVVIPHSLSSAGDFTAVACTEAADPRAAYQRAQRAQFSAEIQNYKDNAARMGIYAHNIPGEMWTALYKVGYPGPNLPHTTVSWVFLPANGGWGVCGRNGCVNSFGITLPEGKWSVEQITPNGGYFLIDLANDKNGHNRRNFAEYNMPAALIAQIQEYLSKGLTIKRVRIGYRGEWFVQAGGVFACLGCPRGDAWTWQNVSDAAQRDLQFVSSAYDRAPRLTRETIQDVAFSPTGGHVILFGKHGYWADGLPEEAMQILQRLSGAKYEVNQVTFGPNDSWIIRANGWW